LSAVIILPSQDQKFVEKFFLNEIEKIGKSHNVRCFQIFRLFCCINVQVHLQLPYYEIPRRVYLDLTFLISQFSFIILKYIEETPFSIENRCLTVSLKKSRPYLSHKYKEEVKRMLTINQSDTEEKLKGIPILIS
jgi:hypothetical protein